MRMSWRRVAGQLRGLRPLDGGSYVRSAVHRPRAVQVAAVRACARAGAVRWHGGHGHSHAHGHGHHVQDGSEDWTRQEMRQALFVTNMGALVNLGLAGAKATAGWLAASPALIADAVHSLSDLASDGVTAVTVYFSRQPADENHPYGHGKIETLGALSVSALLVAGGAAIGLHSYQHMLDALTALEAAMESATAASPTATVLDTVATGVGVSPQNIGVALGVAGVSIVAKEALFRWTLQVGESMHSQVLIANAWHHRSDALSSVVAFAGVGARLLGLDFLDPVAGMMVAAMIAKAGASIGLRSLQELTDQSMDVQLLEEVADEIRGVEEVLELGQLRTRHMGHYVLIDMEIEVDPVLPVSAAHQVGEQVRRTVLAKWPKVTEVLISIRAHEPSAQFHATQGESDDEDDVAFEYPTVTNLENDVKEATMTVPQVLGLSHLRAHFLKGKTVVEMEIWVDQALTVAAASDIALDVKTRVESMTVVDQADVHLELAHVHAEHGMAVLRND